MTARLPIPGEDDGVWGVLLNAFLAVAHNSDGTLQSSAVATAGGELSANKNQPSGYAGLDGNTLVPLALLPSNALTITGSSDVNISSPSNGQALVYSSFSNKWINEALPSAPISSVFGRTGDVTAQSGDYTAAQVTGALQSSNNLSDVVSASTARSNLGVTLSNIGAAPALSPTATQTSSYAAAVNDLAKFDISSGSISQNLPQFPADKSLYAAKIVKVATGNTLTLSTQGSDVINISGGATSYTLTLLNQAVVFQYQVAGAIWNVISDDLPLSQLDSRYPQSGAYLPLTTGMAGAPISGTWTAGQSIIDANGIVWNCTASGSPGTWSQSLLSTSDQGTAGYIRAGTSSPIALVGDRSGNYYVDQTNLLLWGPFTGSGTSGSWGSSGSPMSASPPPGHFGYMGWTIDPVIASASQTYTVGHLFLVRFTAQIGGSCGHLSYFITNAGVTLSAGENFIGVYDTGQTTSGTATLLAQSADQSTNWQTIGLGGAAAAPTGLSTSATLIAGEDYFVGILVNGSTAPTFSASGDLKTAFINTNLSGIAVRIGNYGSSLTSLPSTVASASIGTGIGADYVASVIVSA